MATIKNHLPQVPFSREWLPHLREVALVVGAYFVYMYSRALVFGDFQGIALASAWRVGRGAQGTGTRVPGTGRQ